MLSNIRDGNVIVGGIDDEVSWGITVNINKIIYLKIIYLKKLFKNYFI